MHSSDLSVVALFALACCPEAHAVTHEFSVFCFRQPELAVCRKTVLEPYKQGLPSEPPHNAFTERGYGIRRW